MSVSEMKSRGTLNLEFRSNFPESKAGVVESVVEEEKHGIKCKLSVSCFAGIV